MNSNHPSNERPRSEPEIIPPEHIEARSGKWRSFHQRRTYRIHVTRLGPFSSLAVLLLMLAAFVAILSLILIGAFLIWIPLAVLLIATALISGWWQRTSKADLRADIPLRLLRANSDISRCGKSIVIRSPRQRGRTPMAAL
jgi:hypothetical protein